MTKRRCILCKESPAEVPDRDKPFVGGRLVKRVCRKCHARRLLADLRLRYVANMDASAKKCKDVRDE